MTENDIDVVIARLAANQHGAFSRRQVLAAGGDDSLIARRTKAGVWQRLTVGVYGHRAHRFTFETWCMAAVLGEPQAVLSGRAAAALHELTGFSPCRPEVTVPRGSNHRSKLARVRQSNHVIGTRVKNIPTVTIPHVLCELAGRCSTEALARAFDDAVAAGLTTIDELGQRYADLARCRWPGLAKVRAILEERGEGYEAPASELERLLYALLDHPLIPGVVRQAELSWLPAAHGRVDAYIPAWRLVVEADGRRWHTRVADFEADRLRDNLAVANGCRILRFSWVQLKRDWDTCLLIVLSAGGVQLATSVPPGWLA